MTVREIAKHFFPNMDNPNPCDDPGSLDSFKARQTCASVRQMTTSFFYNTMDPPRLFDWVTFQYVNVDGEVQKQFDGIAALARISVYFNKTTHPDYFVADYDHYPSSAWYV